MIDKTVKFNKIVLMPIKVPAGKYCWDNKRLCSHLKKLGGYPICKLGLYPLEYDKQGFVPKPKKCDELKKKKEK